MTCADLVYVVMGETGEYSDHREWPVSAYLHEDEAKEIVLALHVWLRENEADRTNYRYAETRPACPLDPNFETDYTGTRYYVMPVPLRVAT